MPSFRCVRLGYSMEELLLHRRDTAVLCESLTYERGPPAILNGNAVPGRPWTTVYSPPFDEFEVLHVSIPEKARFQGIQTYLPENLVRLWALCLCAAS